jgi:hypothetical protein
MSATSAVDIQYTTFVVLELRGASGRVAFIVVSWRVAEAESIRNSAADR